MKNDDYVPEIKSLLQAAEMECETASEKWPLPYAIGCAIIVFGILYAISTLRQG